MMGYILEIIEKEGDKITIRVIDDDTGIIYCGEVLKCKECNK